MKKHLLVLSTTQQSDEAIDYALKLTKEKSAKLYIMFILDSDIPATLFAKLTDIGFIGEKPSNDLREAVVNEYKKQAKKVIAKIRQRAKEMDIEVESYMETGAFEQKCLEAVARFQADLLILNRTRQSVFSRLFFGSAFNRLLRRAACEIKIFEE